MFSETQRAMNEQPQAPPEPKPATEITTTETESDRLEYVADQSTTIATDRTFKAMIHLADVACAKAEIEDTYERLVITCKILKKLCAKEKTLATETERLQNTLMVILLTAETAHEEETIKKLLYLDNQEEEVRAKLTALGFRDEKAATLTAIPKETTTTTAATNPTPTSKYATTRKRN
jgi:hypothetical protein